MVRRLGAVSVLLMWLGAMSACGSPERFSNENCAAEWNESAGPAQLATLLNEDPEKAGLYFVGAHSNESRSTDCALVVLAGSSAVLAVLNQDREVQVARVGQTEGAEMLVLGTPVSVNREGKIEAR